MSASYPPLAIARCVQLATILRRRGHEFPDRVVHRRLPTCPEPSQSDFRNSRLLRPDRVEQPRRHEDSRGKIRGCGSTGYNLEGKTPKRSSGHIRQRFPNPPIILFSACCDMPERILWLEDEYVMKSELQERLVGIMERATHPDTLPRSHTRATGVRAQRASTS
jgi:hypothetical protein